MIPWRLPLLLVALVLCTVQAVPVQTTVRGESRAKLPFYAHTTLTVADNSLSPPPPLSLPPFRAFARPALTVAVDDNINEPRGVRTGYKKAKTYAKAAYRPLKTGAKVVKMYGKFHRRDTPAIDE